MNRVYTSVTFDIPEGITEREFENVGYTITALLSAKVAGVNTDYVSMGHDRQERQVTIHIARKDLSPFIPNGVRPEDMFAKTSKTLSGNYKVPESESEKVVRWQRIKKLFSWNR